jgi:hypothetical protein
MNLFLGIWDSAIAASDRSDIIHIDDRLALGGGISRVVASLPDDQRLQTFDAIVSQSLNHLDRWTQIGKSLSSQTHLLPVLDKVGHEIQILAVLFHNYSCWYEERGKASKKSAIPTKITCSDESGLVLLRKTWPTLQYVAENWIDNKVTLF